MDWDWFKEITDHVANAVAAKLAPKFDQTTGKVEAMVGKVEAMGLKVEGLRLDVNRVGTKVDTLGGKVDVIRDKLDKLGGAIDPGLLKQVTDATTHLRVAASTLKAAVELNPPPTE